MTETALHPEASDAGGGRPLPHIVPLVSLRGISLTFGSHQALRGVDLTVYGAGAQTRSFCYVDDLVEALVRMMATPDDVAGPVNLGNPDEFTILELAQKVLVQTGSSARITYRPLPEDDPRQRRPDITLAHTLLHGWVPQINLDNGLRRTIAYFHAADAG